MFLVLVVDDDYRGGCIHIRSVASGDPGSVHGLQSPSPINWMDSDGSWKILEVFRYTWNITTTSKMWQFFGVD